LAIGASDADEELTAIWQEALELYRQGRHADADASCARILARASDHAEALNLRGVVAMANGNFADAEAFLNRALEAAPSLEALYANLAATLFSAGRFDDAIAVSRRGLERFPASTALLFALASAAGSAGQPEVAEAAYREILTRQPRHPDAATNLGALLQRQGQVDAAESLYRDALTSDPRHTMALNNLAGACIEKLRYAEAATTLLQLLELEPDHVQGIGNLGQAMIQLGEFERGTTLLRRAHSMTGDDGYRIAAALAIPPLFESTTAIVEFRASFESRLDRLLESTVRLDRPLAQTRNTCFYLAYHGLDDRALQEKIARLYLRACPGLGFVAPHCRDARPASGRPIRIGFVSANLREHTIGRLFRGLIAGLSRERFEAEIFAPAHPGDAITQFMTRSGVRNTTLPAGLEASRTIVAERKLDMLFYPDPGMNVLTYLLAFSRLAPTQIASWGHPVTTGIPAIDAFVSHEACELTGSAAQYSERLIMMPAGVAYTHYFRPAHSASGRGRRDYGLPDGRTLYLCPHSLFKLHPDFQNALREILRRDAKALIVFMGYGNPGLVNFMKRRLAADGAVDRTVFLGQVSLAAFTDILGLCDVLLDSFHFGGGNTTAEAIATGIPIVTLPGQFMRGRFTQAWLRLLGLDDGIAHSPEHYVDVAVHLGADVEYRRAIRAATLDRSARIYEDRGCVRAFEQALLDAAAAGPIANATIRS
jgi:predicted O-linked N-acetylglucosamine transferase (SPINDLY family)